MRAVSVVGSVVGSAVASAVVVVAVGLSGCCCPCAYAGTGGVPDVSTRRLLPELPPPPARPGRR